MAFEQEGFFIEPHLLCHGTSVFAVSFEGPPHLVASYDKQEVLRTLILTQILMGLKAYFKLQKDFYTPVFRRDVLWYSVVRLSVHPSVCLSGPCRQDRDRTICFRVIQLGTLDHHLERRNPIVFQGQRSKVKAVASLSR